MQYHKQKFLHDPDNGIYGDCARTVIACLMDMEPEQVPHFMDGDPDFDEFTRRQNEWLKLHGLGMVEFPVRCDSLELCIKSIGPNWMPGIKRYMLTGTSPRGTTHVVIVDGDKVHDPAIPGGDLVGPTSDGSWWVSVLVPLKIHG